MAAGAGEATRLEIFRDLLGDARKALDLEFGFELWDGSTVPADLPSYAMRLVVRQESVIASLLRRPTLDTAINWGRYAEIFSYNDHTETFSLEDVEGAT